MLPSLLDRGAVPKTWRSEIAVYQDSISQMLRKHLPGIFLRRMRPTTRRITSTLLAALLSAQTGAAVRAATNILTGPDQVAPGTADANTASTPFQPGGLTAGPRSLFLQERALGDLAGLRGELRQMGIAFSPSYIGEVMGNPTGGNAQGITNDGVFNVPLDLDLQSLSGGWFKNLSLHINGLWLHGQGLSVRKVGDFSNTSNIAGYNTVRLQELWLEQAFWRQRASLRIGLLAADAEFFNTSNGALFLNATFGAFTLVGANLPDPPLFPVAAPGMRIAVHPVPSFIFHAGVYGGGSGGSQDQNNHGTNFNLRSRDGALIFAEVQYLLNQSPGDRGLPGTYQVGSFVHTGSTDFPTFESQTRATLGTGSIHYREADYGVYGVIDQDFLNSSGHTISSFLRVGGSPADANFVDFYVDGGFNFKGFLPHRATDVAGIALAYSSVSNDYSRRQRALGGRGSSAETVFEATYKVQIAPWWSVQPDLQYVFNPSGVDGSHDALVLGVRTAVVF